MQISTQTQNLTDITKSLANEFAERAGTYDREGMFVAENYESLRENRFFPSLVPKEFGGGGVSHSEMCEILRVIAQSCSSTALALSMHQHLVGATVWKYRKGQGGEPLLKTVAEKQPVLVSTGAKDWLESNGQMTKTEGGYLVSGFKHFASQSEAGDIMITSATYHDPEEGEQVLHFPVPFNAEGVTVLNNWDSMGMRGTGSSTIKLEDVFVPEEKIALRRPRGDFHPVWNVVLTVAMPLIMSVYFGIAQKAAEIATDSAKRSFPNNPQIAPAIGKMNNTLTIAELNWKDMIRITNNFDFAPENENGHQILTRKTNVANACISVVDQALDIVGGQGYLKNSRMERLFRDVQGARFHPLRESEQIKFSGEHLLRASTY
jgi:alkylation response protein AidB-like acyl-CoA dehydrogenase